MFNNGKKRIGAGLRQDSLPPGTGNNAKARFLTDHRIPQSEKWKRATTYTGSQQFHGYLGALLHAVRVAFGWRKYDILITANIQHALLYCLVKRLWRFRAPRIMVLEARLDDPLPTVRWKVKRTLQRFAFQSVDLICVSARQEIDLYGERLGLAASKFEFVPWHTNILEPTLIPSDGGYVFSAGRTGRDWETFFGAVDGMPWKVVVVSSKALIRVNSLPQNVTAYFDIPYSEYLELLKNARVVIVPLESHVYSSGQVAFLEAMALGKPVIATDVVGTKDYIKDGNNGLLVPPYSETDIRHAIQRLFNDDALSDRIRRRALDGVIVRHTLDAYVSTILRLASERAHQ